MLQFELFDKNSLKIIFLVGVQYLTFVSLIHLIFSLQFNFFYVKLGRVSFFGRYYGNLRLRFVSMRECTRWRDGLISGDNCTQRPDVSKYVRSVSNGFLQAFVACLVILKLPQKLVVCSDVLGELWSSCRLGSLFPAFR